MATNVFGEVVNSNEATLQWVGRDRFESVDVDKCVAETLGLKKECSLDAILLSGALNVVQGRRGSAAKNLANLAAFASDKKESLFAPILSLTLSSAFVRKVIMALPFCFTRRVQY